MTPLEADFLRRLIAIRPEFRDLGITAEHLAKLEHIGTIRRNRVFYTSGDFERGKNLLLSRGIPFETSGQPYSRSLAPAGLSEKIGASPVSTGLVAVRGLNMPGLVAPAGSFVAAKAIDVVRWEYQVLMVVENLEALMRIEEYKWLEIYVRGRPTLAAFRGTLGWFKPDAAAHLVRGDERPILAFFDFDPKGLAMAASLPRREALCLPDLQALEAATIAQSRRNLYTQSADVSASQLSRESDPKIRGAWEMLQRLAMGLDQEHFPT